LVVVYDVSEVVSSAVVCLAHAHRVVREVDIAVITWRMLGFLVKLVEEISNLAVVVAVLKRKCLQKTVSDVSGPYESRGICHLHFGMFASLYLQHEGCGLNSR
jgi:hypothetical protein